MHGQLVKRAFAIWQPETATPAQCIATRQMADGHPEFLSSPKALEWSVSESRQHIHSRIGLLPFLVFAQSLVNEEMDTASQIANELNT